MTAGTTRPGRTKTEDQLVGRSYLCCRGPRKGQSVAVIGLADAGGARYTLEGERGGQWTISAEKLRRIFGPARNRRCDCYPLDKEQTDQVADKSDATPEEAAAPAETSATAVEDETVVQEAGPLDDAIPAPEETMPIPPAESSAGSAQGRLF